MSRLITFTAAAITAIALTACVDEADLGAEDQAILPCPKMWGCGENSPVMGPWNFHELDEAGTANLEGVKLIGMVQNGAVYKVDVKGAQLFGVADDGTVISGAALTNAYMVVVAPDNIYKIFIKKVSPLAQSFTTFWIGPHDPIETYELTYSKWNGDQMHLCNNPPERASGEAIDRMWARPIEAILFAGDRYDSARKLVTASTDEQAGTWFNIACAGSALAKLELTRHTTHGMTAGFASGKNERQAMLKMYTSDLCGTGAAFTAKGTPLHWQNKLGWSTFDGTEFDHESYWNENGATCLDTHRRFDEYLPQIDAECTAARHYLPPCDRSRVVGTYVSSAVPLPPGP